MSTKGTYVRASFIPCTGTLRLHGLGPITDDIVLCSYFCYNQTESLMCTMHEFVPNDDSVTS